MKINAALVFCYLDESFKKPQKLKHLRFSRIKKEIT
jgi:hypothetical protein